MLTTTLVLPETMGRPLRGMLAERHESAAVVLAGAAWAPDGELRLLGRELHPVPDDCYEWRERTELVVGTDGWVPALGRAAEIGASAIWFHTHPGAGANPKPSARDRDVDEQLAEPFRIRSGNELYGSLIFAGTPERVRFSGRVLHREQSSKIERLWEIGDRLRLTDNQPNATTVDSGLFDRNIRAFGGAVQKTLSELAVGLVGAGGTGSAVAEQLIRLGVRKLRVIDPDTLSVSNLTRVYGSTPGDVGQSKARVLAAHLRRIAPDAEVEAIVGTVTEERTARELVGCDVVFGCTDDNAGRLVLSRVASYLLTAVIDCGVLLSSGAGGAVTGIDARVTVLTPGAACLICRDRIDLKRAQSELLPAGEGSRLQREGYAAALPGVEPAVVAYTTAAAAAAVGELIERLVGYGQEPTPSEVLLRLHDREVSVNRAAPREGHYCDPATGKLGVGEGGPFLEQTWTS
jgi:molybdopterin/thiamine biosynthesis adenylyltransferase